MPDVTLDLPWWPPDPGEPIGLDHAHDLVTMLVLSGQPVVEAAEDDLRSRLEPGAEIVTTRSAVAFLALWAFTDPLVDAAPVGMVVSATGDPPEINSIQLHRDGVLRWRRE